jgi:Fe2+ or Zn2+ uptake regulation protein
MKSSFKDEDWSGLSKEQIYKQIVAELEEQQCKREGHQWSPVLICQNCGETFEFTTTAEAVKECKFSCIELSNNNNNNKKKKS